MRQELLRLLEAEERFFARNLRWGTREELGPSFVPVQGVTVHVTIDGAGWAWGVATYRDADDVCVIQFDTVPAAPTCR